MSNSAMTDGATVSGLQHAVRGPMPASAGIGLRSRHHAQVLQESPAVGWFEAHSEHYFAEGGAQVDCLARIRADYPLFIRAQ